MAEAGLQERAGEGGAVEHIVRHLSQGASQNRYAPGQRLIEADLTRDLGVSRGPVREAFRAVGRGPDRDRAEPAPRFAG